MVIQGVGHKAPTAVVSQHVCVHAKIKKVHVVKHSDVQSLSFSP